MADVTIPTTYGLAVFTWFITGRANPVTSTLGYATAGGTTDPQDAADALFADMSATGGYSEEGSMVNAWSFDNVKVYQNVAGTINLAQSAASPIQGISGTGALPPINGSLLVQKRTVLVGRSKRGRMYLPNLSVLEGDVDNLGNISTTSSGGLVAGYWSVTEGALLSDPEVQPVILHTDPLEPPTLITSMPFQFKLATQRRRMR